MKAIAVLTGDIIQSRKLQNGDIEILLEKLRTCFEAIQENILTTKAQYEFYRGDSFQILLNEPEQALKVAIIIRSCLRSIFNSHSSSKGITETKSDARISIGVGSLRMQNNRLAESQGEAFELSGTELDFIKKEALNLSIKTRWDSINEEFKVNCLFADNAINNWSSKTAESIYRYLLYGETQKEQAIFFNVSQPAISKRLISQGNIKAINAFISRYQNVITNKTK